MTGDSREEASESNDSGAFFLWGDRDLFFSDFWLAMLGLYWPNN